MKTTIMLPLLGLCLNTANVKAAETTTTANAVVTDTARRIETPVKIKEPPEIGKEPDDGAGGGITIGGGVYNQPLQNFNAVLNKHGFNALDENMTMLSLGFFGLINPRNRMGLDFEYYWSEQASAIADSSALGLVSVRGFNIGIKGGYDFVNQPKWGLMPIYRVGYYSHTYDFEPRHNSLDDILNGNSSDAVKLTYSGIALTAGLNVYVQTKMDKETKQKGKLHEPTAGLNLEGGVHYYPLRNMNMTLDNGPQMSRYGLYLKLYLYLGEKVSPLLPKDKE